MVLLVIVSDDILFSRQSVCLLPFLERQGDNVGVARHVADMSPTYPTKVPTANRQDQFQRTHLNLLLLQPYYEAPRRGRHQNYQGYFDGSERRVIHQIGSLS